MPDNRRKQAAPPVDSADDAPAATIVTMPKTASQQQKPDARAKPERIGDILRRARVARNEDLYHIAEYLCIKPAFLIAIENSRYDEFTADAYVIGFLRTYATFLGVDSRDAVDRYRVEMAGSRKKPILAMPIPLTEGRAPSGIIVVGAAVAILALYALWYGLSSTNRTEVSAPPPLPIATAPMAATPVDSAPSSAVPSGPAPATSAPPSATPAATTAPTAPVPASAPAAASGTIPPAAPGIVLTAAAPAPAKATIAPGAPATADGEAPTVASDNKMPSDSSAKPAASDTGKPAAKTPDDQTQQSQPGASPGKAIYGNPDQAVRVILRATQTTWVNVTDASGQVVFDHVLKAGDIYKVPNEPGMHLNTGNGNGLAVTVDGSPVAKVASGSPHVVRDISLDPAHLQAGEATP